MKTRGMLLSVVLIVGVVLGVFGSQVLGAQPDSDEPIAQEELQRHDLTTAEGKQAAMVRTRLAPGVKVSEEPTVMHPVDEFVYVLEGSAILTREGDDPVEFGAGEAWHNEFEQPHTLANASSDEPLTILSVWIGDAGAF